MLARVPAFTIREAIQERGLGQATGNVLLNGQRISGKSDDVQTRLSRIPAGNVIRIEIRDGATLDIPGLSGQVANVVVRATGITGQYAWRPEFRRYFTDPLFTRFETSVRRPPGPINYAGPREPVLAQRRRRHHHHPRRRRQPARHARRRVDRRVRAAAGQRPLRARRAGQLGRQPQHVLPAVLVRLCRERLPHRPGRVDRNRQVLIEEDGHNYEIGGDFEFALGPGRLKLIGLDRFSHSVPDTLVVTRFADQSPDAGDRFARVGDESERIGRLEYRWNMAGGATGRSRPRRRSTASTTSRSCSSSTRSASSSRSRSGGTARVEEDRYEVMASHGRALSPNLRVQLALGGEYSQLSQIGGGGLTRTFWRPKGRCRRRGSPTR